MCNKTLVFLMLLAECTAVAGVLYGYSRFPGSGQTPHPVIRSFSIIEAKKVPMMKRSDFSTAASITSALAVLGAFSTLLFAAPDDAVQMATDCKKQSGQEKMSCYQQQQEAMLKTHGTEQALTALEQLATRDPDVLRDAHVYAHYLGRISFSHYKDAPTAFSHCRDIFWSGCYHGVLEGYLSSIPQVEPKDIATLCDKAIDTTQSLFLKYQCVHGLGHGLTMYFQHNIFTALSFCDALPTDWDRESCYGGVFMENIVAFQNPHHQHHAHHAGHQILLKPQDPLYPCNAVAKQYQRACYLMQTSAILTFAKQDFAQAFRECDKAPTEFIPTCYQSLGRDISGSTLRDAKKTRGLCQKGSPEHLRYCLVGAVKDFILTYADPQRGFAFCRTVDTAYKQDCYAAVGEILISLYPDREARGQACTQAEEAYTAACKASAYSY